MLNFENAIILFLVVLWLIVVFAVKGERNPQEPYESGWLSNEHSHQPSQSDESESEDNDWWNGRQTNNAPIEELETPMQKFRRENSMREVVKRGGFLTTGERMEAMYGACEEAAQCFPEDYYRQDDKQDN